MAIEGLLGRIAASKDFHQIEAALKERKGAQALNGLSGSQKSLYIASIYQATPGQTYRPRLILTHTAYQAERLAADLAALLGDEEVMVFPPLETLPHEEVTPSIELNRDRLAALQRMTDPENNTGIVVVPVQSLGERLVPASVFRQHIRIIDLASRLDLEEVGAFLVNMGYERISMVEGPAQFSVRGGILDLYPITALGPVRIELFDDEVDSIRRFDIETQRSIDRVEQILIVPAREFIFPPDTGPGVAQLQEAGAAQVRRLQKLDLDEAADKLAERLGEHVEKLREGIAFEGMDQYKPFFYQELHTVVDYLANGTVIVDETARVREHLKGMEQENAERHTMLLQKGRILPQESQLYVGWEDIAAALKSRSVVHVAGLPKRTGAAIDLVYHINARTPEPFHSRLTRLTQELTRWRREKFSVCLTLSTRDRAERIREVLREEGISAVWAPTLDGELKPGQVTVTIGSLESGAEFPDLKLVVLSDTEVFGQTKRRRRRHTRTDEKGTRITNFEDLKTGDYVVHVNHGIGKYLGVETLEIAGVHKDYLVLKYAGEDKLYVPTDQVDLLQKYIGVESQAPRLNKLGGNEWAKVKNRAKESVREMAEGLLQLYAERETVPGYQYSRDTVWQRQFEDTFPFEETPDQERAIWEVKKDMETEQPMDRLICGDVGYGKTEVAIRATFKAVMDGKQVVFLVPTTILAQQHGRTFVDRFSGFPMNVQVLSRFQTQAEQRRIVKGIAAGTVDVVIGTHRILSKDIRFHDLGLVVVDEEQRFGVAQKERLKELRKNVDVLTLTATPIPRTLHMALVGVRDMSVIETPPEDRFPIRTYVVPYDDDMIREAIMRELGRKGQVYFVYNRVKDIDRMYGRLHKLVPEVRIAVAHGQMDEHQLEPVMLDFLAGEYDVLLCSTIIETGMDISNVNTLIVHDADQLGLAQLYQLRGRVGRSNRVAYAYFTYGRDKVLSEDAEKRLEAVKEFTELGSGFKIAMRDLEIRGAGNLLGAEQHGFIASVGFELYCKLLKESIKELKGEMVQQPPDPVIDLSIDAYISDQYVPDSQQKVDIYKKVVGIREIEEVDDLEEELEDRYGDLPQSARNLLMVARLKVLAKEIGVQSVTSSKDGIQVKMLVGLSLPKEPLMQLSRRYRGRLLFIPSRAGQFRVRSKGISDSETLRIVRESLAYIRNGFAKKPAVSSGVAGS